MKKIELVMLQVEKGEEMPVIFTDETAAITIAEILKLCTDNGYVLSGVEIQEV